MQKLNSDNMLMIGEQPNTISITIIIPVYNEAILLEEAIHNLHQELKQLDRGYELLIAENGSTDGTQEIVEELAAKYPQVRGLHVNEPNYGLALRRGIQEALGTYVICDEIDICDLDFYKRALAFLEADTADLIVGSKRHPDATDRRPWIRRMGTATINTLLKVLFHFKGTDTHGLKAFHRHRLLPIVEKCIVDKDIFATEFAIRSHQANLRTIEIPIAIEEKRKTAIPLFRRVPKALQQIAKLFVVIRFNHEF